MSKGRPLTGPVGCADGLDTGLLSWSEAPPSDGAWFRAFDFARWEFWASNADAGWGTWSIETGWTQGWIVAVLAMRQTKTSFWELTADSKIGRHMSNLQPLMIPDDALPKPGSAECPS